MRTPIPLSESLSAAAPATSLPDGNAMPATGWHAVLRTAGDGSKAPYGRTIDVQLHRTPCGDVVLGAWQGQLCLCDWAARRDAATVARRLQRALHASFALQPSPATEAAARQVDEYFALSRTLFDLPLLTVGSDFQQQVWRQLQAVRYGETLTYGALAASLGRRDAVRAVARAVGSNALSLFVPCHRIVGADGALTGYAGGLEAKRLLLDLEQGSRQPELPLRQA